MSVSGLRTSVPLSVRVCSAVADTPHSTQAVSCGSRQRHKGDHSPEKCFFLPGRVRRASARESPCQTPDWSTKIGGRKWGHAVPWVRELPARDNAKSKTASPTVSPSPVQESVHVLDVHVQHEGRRTAHECNRTSHPRGFTHSHSLTSSTARRKAQHSAHVSTCPHAALAHTEGSRVRLSSKASLSFGRPVH